MGLYDALPQLGSIIFLGDPGADGSGQVLTDQSGNGNAQLGNTTGTDTNDPTWVYPSLRFLTDDHVKASLAVYPTNQFTVLGIVKPSSLTGYPTLVGRWGGEDKNFKLSLSLGGNGCPYIDVSGSGSDDNYRVSATAITTVAYHMVCGVYDGSNTRLDMYVNGAKANGALDGTIPSILPATTRNLYIGSDTGTTLFASGDVGFIVLYNTALSDTEYLQAFNAIGAIMDARGITLDGYTPTSGTIETVTATSYANRIYAIPFRAASVIRTKSGIILPVASDAYRIGQGVRADTSTVNPVVASANRAGQGVRTESSTAQSVTAQASRVAIAVQTIVSWARRIMGKAVALTSGLKGGLNCTVGVRYRTTTVGVKTRTTKVGVRE